MAFLQAIYSSLQILSWHDTFEIFCFIVMAYGFLWWLARDRARSLDLLFCSFYSCAFIAWAADFTALSYLVMSMLPAATAMLIVLHQRYFQRSLIGRAVSDEPLHVSDAWLDTLMSWSLQAAHRTISLVWFIEQQDTLTAALTPAGTMHADLTPQLMELLFSSPFHQPLMIWVNRNGKLIAFQPRSTVQVEQHLLAPESEKLPLWHQHALIMSSSLDALILHSDHTQRLFTLIVQGKTVEQLSSHHALTVLKHQLYPATDPRKEHSWHHASSPLPAHQQSGRSGHVTSGTPPGL